MNRARYARFAWVVLAFNLFVIAWGAFVRATGSGAGCGSHWPLCNGEMVPRAPALATLIEFGHRLTSGAALILVVLLAVFAWRLHPRGHAVRRSAGLALALIVSEALIGAGLVLLQMVAENASMARGFWVAGHLMNTFLLVAVLALTAWWAGDRPAPRLPGQGGIAMLLAAALGGVLMLGVSGAVTALGDTLFRVSSLEEAKALTFSDTAHVFVRLRIWHPTLAVIVGVLVFVTVWAGLSSRPSVETRRLGLAVVGLYVSQLALGLLNVWLLAPVWLQLVHLLLSDFLWIALVLFAAEALAASSFVPLNDLAQTTPRLAKADQP